MSTARRSRDFTDRLYRICSRSMALFSVLGMGYFSVITALGVWNTAARRRERSRALEADFFAELENERQKKAREEEAFGKNEAFGQE